ncbi:hypothetical protein [Paraburkholderia sp. MM6662-R1]|uniref:hypothetical protein n=1 Tax=Paraburkholderia sp. MM6662-R1 TaxID=2991066 RepID=UPI003D1B9C98
MKTTSMRMLMAIQLVQAGATGYAAAREAGITPQAVYQNEMYRSIIARRRARGVPLRRAYPRRKPVDGA